MGNGITALEEAYRQCDKLNARIKELEAENRELRGPRCNTNSESGHMLVEDALIVKAKDGGAA